LPDRQLLIDALQLNVVFPLDALLDAVDDPVGLGLATVDKQPPRALGTLRRTSRMTRPRTTPRAKATRQLTSTGRPLIRGTVSKAPTPAPSQYVPLIGVIVTGQGRKSEVSYVRSVREV